jgi:hypothetical protein
MEEYYFICYNIRYFHLCAGRTYLLGSPLGESFHKIGVGEKHRSWISNMTMTPLEED